MRDCITCGSELKRGEQGVCSACFFIAGKRTRCVTCDNCGREFQSEEVNYDRLLDSCPHCGRK